MNMKYFLYLQNIDFWYAILTTVYVILTFTIYKIRKETSYKVQWTFFLLHSIMFSLYYFIEFQTVYSTVKQDYLFTINDLSYFLALVFYIEFCIMNIHNEFKMKIQRKIYFVIFIILLPFVYISIEYFVLLLKLSLLLFSAILSIVFYNLHYNKFSLFNKYFSIPTILFYFSFHALLLFKDKFSILFNQMIFFFLSLFIILIFTILWFIIEKQEKSIFINLYILLLLFIINLIIIFGYTFTVYVGNKKEIDLRNDLISVGNTCASTIPYDYILQLNKNESDEHNPYFIELKKHLIFLKSLNKEIKNMYIYTHKDKFMQFLVDAEKLGDTFYIPPGYIDTTYELEGPDLNIFFNKQSFIDGPYKDEQGIWISGSFPILNPYNDKIVAVLGIDISANKWAEKIFFYRISPIGITILLILLSFFTFYIIIFKISFKKKILVTEKRFSILFNNSKDAILLVNNYNGNIILSNPAAEKLFKCSQKDLLNKKFIDFISKGNLTLFSEKLIKHLNSEKNIPFETQIINCNNETIFVEINATYIELPNIESTVHYVIRDITEKKLLEKEKEEMEKHLEQIQKLEVIGQLASGVAHDFNNILGVITMNCDIILSNTKNKKIIDSINAILQSAESATSLNRELLTFARQGHYNITVFNAHEIIENSLIILKDTIDKKIEIKKEFSALHYFIKGDKSKFENSILNLCTNARDAMPNGGTITIKTENIYLNKKDIIYNFVEEGVYIKISIKDTGIGMDDRTKSKLFQPFFTTKVNGTGMGLASTYGYVKKLNGFIEVYSELNKGTEFQLFFPISEKENIDIQKIKKYEKTKPHKKSIKLSEKTILLIDDNDLIRKALALILKNNKYIVIEKNNGKEGLEYYNNHYKEIDLVILDMIMPKMNGKEVFDLMYKINPNVKVLLSTGYSLEEKARYILSKSEYVDFIQKPFGKDNILNKIEKLLNK